MKSYVVLAILLASGPAMADVCTPVDGNSRTNVECITDEMFEWQIAEEDPELAAELTYTLNEARADLNAQPGQDLVVDFSYQMRVADTIQVTDTIRQLTEPLPALTWQDYYQRFSVQYGYAPPPHLVEHLGSGSYFQVSQGLGIGTDDAGVNTDGQVLYGPPGGFAEWGCTGYGSVDTCKGCCMASRTVFLGVLISMAEKCHVGATACAAFFGVGALTCHIACGVAEGIALGALIYSTSKCNGNCEDVFWNDTSIDWTGPNQDRLTGMTECLGWSRGRGVVEINGGEHISIPGVKLVDDINAGTQKVLCVALERGEVWDDFPTGTKTRILGRSVECPPATTPSVPRGGHPMVEGSHEGIRCIEVEDYRVVDIHPNESFDQTPYVGILEVDDENNLFIDRIRGGRLYLDLPSPGIYVLFLTWGVNMKVAVYGDVVGNEMAVTYIRELALW